MEPKKDCPICFESLTGKTIGSPDTCNHKFCLSCLEKWCKHGNFCPVDRQPFKKIICGNKVIQIKFKKRKRAQDLYDISVCCEICKESKEDNDTVILCDSCDLAFHFDCLEPPLKRVPRGSWFCHDCQKVERKLKAKKTKQKSCPNSEERSSKPSQCLNSSNKQTDISLRKVNRVSSIIDQSSSSTNQTNISLLKEDGISSSIDHSKNIKFTKDKHNQTHLFKKDYCYQNNLPKTVNSSLYYTEIPSGEFEDFFSICDNDVILTNRKLLSTEEPSLQLFRAQQTNRTSKRLPAASERNKVFLKFVKDTIESPDDSSSSSVAYCATEKGFPENTSLNAKNYSSDIEKSEFPSQSSNFFLKNKNEKNYTFEFSSSSTECINELGLEDSNEKNIPMKEINKTALLMPDEPANILANSKSLDLDNLSKEKFGIKETSNANSNTNCRYLRKKLPVLKSKRLAAENARKKIVQNIKCIYYEHSNSEFSDSSSTSKCMDEFGLKDYKGNYIPIKERKKTATSLPSSISENFLTFSNTELSGQVSGVDSKNVNSHCLSEKGDYKTAFKILKEKYSVLKELISSETLNVSDEPVSNSVNTKSLNLDILWKEKSEKKETSNTKISTNCRPLRKKFQSSQKNLETKNLAAANARKKIVRSIKNIYYERFGDDSSDHHSVTKNDSEPQLYLNTSNCICFANIEKVFPHQNATFCNNKSEVNPLNEFSSSKSRSEIATLGFDSRSIKNKNPTVEDLNKSVTSNLSSMHKCHRSAYVKLKDCLKEDANRIQIPMGSKSFSVFEKSTIEEPPDIISESLNFSKNVSYATPPKLLIEPLTACKNTGNNISPIIEDTEKVKNTFVLKESNYSKTKSSEVFNIFEKVTDASCFIEEHSNIKMINTEETYTPMKSCQDADSSKNDKLSLEKDNFPDVEISAGENIDDFHIRQKHYAIKAKMNLSAELRQIERETWLSRKSKSSKKFKYKSPKEAEIHISSSSHHIIAGNAELYQYFKNTRLGNNKSTDCKKDLTDYNICNPFYQSVSGTCPKTLFKVTEYSLKPFDKSVCFNKIPKDILQSFMSPNSLKHLDIREDGSLFLNWPKTNSH